MVGNLCLVTRKYIAAGCTVLQRHTRVAGCAFAAVFMDQVQWKWNWEHLLPPDGDALA
jgi:hypothetical protein